MKFDPQSQAYVSELLNQIVSLSQRCAQLAFEKSELAELLKAKAEKRTEA